jgi:solute carrier family 35 protein E1
MSRYFLKHKYDSKVALSLVPIVVGVTMSSAVEIEFNWWGLLTALGSTFLFVCQNLYSKYLFTVRHCLHPLLRFIFHRLADQKKA